MSFFPSLLLDRCWTDVICYSFKCCSKSKCIGMSHNCFSGLFFLKTNAHSRALTWLWRGTILAKTPVIILWINWFISSEFKINCFPCSLLITRVSIIHWTGDQLFPGRGSLWVATKPCSHAVGKHWYIGHPCCKMTEDLTKCVDEVSSNHI